MLVNVGTGKPVAPLILILHCSLTRAFSQNRPKLFIRFSYDTITSSLPPSGSSISVVIHCWTRPSHHQRVSPLNFYSLLLHILSFYRLIVSIVFFYSHTIKRLRPLIVAGAIQIPIDWLIDWSSSPSSRSFRIGIGDSKRPRRLSGSTAKAQQNNTSY